MRPDASTTYAPRGRGLRLLNGVGRPARTGERARVDLFEAERDFADAVPAGERELARAVLRLPRLTLPAGDWDGPPARDGDEPPACLLVVDGLLSHSLAVSGRAGIELHGPGDLIGCDGAPVPGDAAWKVHQAATLVFLDDRFALAAARWPGLWHVVVRRSAARAQRLAAHLAALQLSRVDDRLEAVLWQLADRWGRVTPDGVVVPLTLTHELLGRLAAAKRPTVSVALSALAERGAVTRRADGAWVLRRA